MKKHDEGYALVFVLIVMTVLSTVALTLMTGAMRNLQAQTTSLQQMQAKYEAEGEIEKVVALIEAAFETDGTEKYNSAEGVQPRVEHILIGNGPIEWQPDYPTDVQFLSENISTVKWNIDLIQGREKLNWPEDDSCEIHLSVEAIKNHSKVNIKCSMLLSDVIRVLDGENQYSYTKPTIIYNSYTIEYTDTSETEEVPGE